MPVHRQSARAAERRKNRPLRDQAQSWFDAVRADMAGDPANIAIVSGLERWHRLEDVMYECPQLVPLLLNMAWQRREDEKFAALFQTTSGDIAKDKADVLALSHSSFNSILVSSLRGALRIICERNEKTWLKREQDKHSSWVYQLPFLGQIFQQLGVVRRRDKIELLRGYSRHGLYNAIKPFLIHVSQFQTLEAYSALSTRSAIMLGPRIRSLIDPVIVRTIAGIDQSSLAFAVQIADMYVSNRGISAGPSDIEASGRALTNFLSTGAETLKIAMNQQAKSVEAVGKLAPFLGEDTWEVLTDKEKLASALDCPGAFALGLGKLVVFVCREIAREVERISDARVSAAFARGLRELCGDDTLATWLNQSALSGTWKKIVKDLNLEFKQVGSGDKLTDHEDRLVQQSVRNARKNLVSGSNSSKSVSSSHGVSLSVQAA
jgi:hypothetical protein